ncbi:MAG: hypothetical protein CMF55_01985 [Legionellales bacterium]|nr:hypothetical protein [Legionellales bacterium]HAG62301.1 hypothetical protein [Coxiellaceae bacterium]|tara:strand:- start:101 stop:403 length:303 start_codon:yes stop_codon:yes gene_type:complete
MSSSVDVCRLKPVALGLAIAVLSALSLLFVVFTALCFGVGFPWLGIIASIYVGFNLSFIGIIIGLVWAIIDGFIAGIVLAWLYNAFSCCGCPMKSRESDA